MTRLRVISVDVRLRWAFPARGARRSHRARGIEVSRAGNRGCVESRHRLGHAPLRASRALLGQKVSRANDGCGDYLPGDIGATSDRCTCSQARRGPIEHRTHSVIASCMAPVVHGSSDPIELRARTSLGLSKPGRARLPYTPSVTQSPIPLVNLRRSLVRSSMDRMLRRCGVSA
jgi:hypothetical protein